MEGQEGSSISGAGRDKRVVPRVGQGGMTSL